MSPVVLACVVLVALLVFGIAAAAVGHLPGLEPAEPASFYDHGGGLPPGRLQAEDLPRVRFGLVVRGYRCSEVDEFVARMADELRLREQEQPAFGTED